MNNIETLNNKNKKFVLWSKFEESFFSEKSKSSRRKCFNTLWAIIFGFVVSGIIISFSNQNPFSVFWSLFTEGTTTYGNKLISVFMGYLIASLAVAICFKSGLFNIGISSQMMMGGFITLLIFNSKIQITHGSIFLALIMSVLAGAFIAVLAGLLKTMFNINEVVSTIMLNWIVFFLIKFFIQDLPLGYIADADSLTNNLSLGYTMPNFYQPQDLNGSWFSNSWNWIIIFIGLSLTICLWWIISKTSFGYKIKMVGLNQNAADYSGTNKKALILIVMAISGGLSGLAGFIWYIGQGGQIDVAEQPLAAGFEAIAISLLVYNNPIGIVLSSLLYGIMNVGSSVLPTIFIGMPREMNEIIVGIMIYTAAISVVFSKLNVYQWIRNFFIFSKVKEYRIERTNYWKNKWNYWVSWFVIKKEIIEIKNKNKKEWHKIEFEYKKRIKELDQVFLNKYKDQMKKIINVQVMTNEDQIYYFEELSKFKKEKNMELAVNNYFEKNNIKAKRVENHKKAKYKYNQLKEEILKEHKIYSYWKNSLIKHKLLDSNGNEAKIVVRNAWLQMEELYLNRKYISIKTLNKLKNSIKKYAEKYDITIVEENKLGGI